jgi:hypothetical protein
MKLEDAFRSAGGFVSVSDALDFIWLIDIQAIVDNKVIAVNNYSFNVLSFAESDLIATHTSS